MERPTSVSVIGWFFIVMGGLSVISGALALALSASLETESDLVPLWQIIVQIILASSAVIGGFYFIKGSVLSRYYLEVLTWVCLILLVYFLRNFTGFLSSGGMGATVFIINTLVMLVPLGLILYFIRCSKVKAYIEHNKASQVTAEA